MARRKGFDPDAALEKAMSVFWEKGYAATSVQDLVDRMGINRFSLYDTFGDKHALYLAALDRYQDQQNERLVRALEETEDGLAAICRYFEGLETAFGECETSRGCFAQHATLELSGTDPEVAARVREFHLRQEKAIHVALKRARDAGRLSRRRNLRDLARLLYAAGQGLIVMGRSGHDAGGAAGVRRFVEAEFGGAEPGGAESGGAAD